MVGESGLCVGTFDLGAALRATAGDVPAQVVAALIAKVAASFHQIEALV
jgi:hypothetical protein